MELEYHALVKRYAKSGAARSHLPLSAAAENAEESKVADGVNGEGDAGHGTTESAGRSEEAAGAGIGLDAKGLEGHADATLYVRPFSSTVPRAPLEKLLRERGGPFVRFLLSDPAKSTYCNMRSAWLVYATKEQADSARQTLHNTEAEHPLEEQVRAGQQPPPPDYFRPFTLQLSAHNGKRTVPVPLDLSDPKHLEKDATQVNRQRDSVQNVKRTSHVTVFAVENS